MNHRQSIQHAIELSKKAKSPIFKSSRRSESGYEIMIHSRNFLHHVCVYLSILIKVIINLHNIKKNVIVIKNLN